MRHQKQYHLRRPKEALRRVAERFGALGFTAEEQNDYFVRLTGPGIRSTKQDLLMGIDRAELRVEGDGLKVELEITAFQRLFQKILLSVLALLMVVAFVIPFVASGGDAKTAPRHGYWLAMSLAIAGNVLMWFFLLPLVGRLFGRRVVRVVEGLLEEPNR